MRYCDGLREAPVVATRLPRGDQGRTVTNRGEIQTYRTLYDTAHYEGFVAGSGEDGYRTNVRSLMKRMRRKFLTADPGFGEIENVHGAGYRWRASYL
jgi:DNA-binding response OmpR family regulator